MKKIIITIISLALLFIVQPTTATPTNLVVNGDFELPEVTNSSKWQIFPSDEVPGWTVEWAGVYPEAPATANLELHEGVLMPAYDGDQSVEMDTDWSSANGEPASVKIYQDIETCAGGEYTLSYAWSPRPGHNDNAMKVYWGESLVGNHSGSASGWNLEIVTSLTASGAATRLKFIETGNPDSLGMFLDAVSVEQSGECDEDGDGVKDDEDNCPADSNPDQEDIDGDGLGDICDACPNDPENDQDGDGICGDVDNCRADYNSKQEDIDEDGIGSICDNCLDVLNPDQTDSDGDGEGDACEPMVCTVTTEDLTVADDRSHVAMARLGTNRWIIKEDNGNFVWVTTPPNGRGWDKSFDIEETHGCNCEQILTWLHNNYPEEYGEMNGHWKFGCSKSIIEDFISLTE